MPVLIFLTWFEFREMSFFKWCQKPSLNIVDWMFFFPFPLCSSQPILPLCMKRGREAHAWVGVFVAHKALDCLGSVGIRDGNHHISHSGFSHSVLSQSTVSSPTLIPALSASTCCFSNPAFLLRNLQSHNVCAETFPYYLSGYSVTGSIIGNDMFWKSMRIREDPERISIRVIMNKIITDELCIGLGVFFY